MPVSKSVGKVREEDIQLPVEVAGVRFRNPFYVASGPTTMTIDQLIRIEETGWGGASLKLTLDPPPYINRHPRYAYYPGDGILSFTTERRLLFDQALALAEEGRKRTSRIILFSNFTYAGDKGVAGWVNMAKKFESAGVHVNELNMCCPNMSYNVELSSGSTSGPKTGASLGQQLDAVKEIVRAIKAETRIPLFVKLTPEGGRIAHVAKACYEAGANAVGTTANRLAIHHVDLENPTRGLALLQDEVSMQCMCSSWVHPLGLRDVYEIRKVNGPDVAITGAGGVSDWKSAAEMLLCGATLVGICSETLISGFGFLPDMVRGLKEWLAQHPEFDTLRRLSNVIPPSITAASDVTLYAGHARLKDPGLSAPCVDACPAHVPAQAYVSKIAEGNFEEAFHFITSAAPFQSICGYICPHPCEEVCTRGERDDPVRIRDLKRFILNHGKAKGWKPKMLAGKSNGRKVAVIGSGPSGITAAHLLARAGYAVTVFESEREAGGLLRFAIPMFRLPMSLLDDEIAQVKSLGVRFEFGRKLGDNLHLEDLKKDFNAVYLAIGAQRALTGDIKGETAKGCMTALHFLKKVAVDRSYPLGRRVAVIGGGFTAVDSARTAVRLGASEVYILYRRTRDEMPASTEEVREAEDEGVRVMYLVQPSEIAHDRGRATGVRLMPCVLGAPDASGRRAPVPLADASFILPVDTVIFAVSQGVDVPAREGVPLSRRGTLLVDDSGFTGQEKVYAGGDAVLGARTIIEAVASAIQAAHAIDRDLMGAQAVLKPLPDTQRVNADAVLGRSTGERLWRVPLDLVTATDRANSFEPYAKDLTEEEAVREAARCLHCGCGVGCQICHDICKMFAWDIEGSRVHLREDACVACGMCVWRCPNQNIEMIKTSDAPI